jgi:hypothetical protein
MMDGGSIQAKLLTIKVGELPWPNSLGVDVKILIAHETHESAARFLIRDH